MPKAKILDKTIFFVDIAFRYAVIAKSFYHCYDLIIINQLILFMLKNCPHPQKGSVEISTFAGITIIAAVVVIISTAAVIKYREIPNAIAPVAVITPTVNPAIDAKIADWEIYKNDALGFEIKYPNDLQSKFTNNELEIFSTPVICDTDITNKKIEGNEIKITINQYAGLTFAQTWKNVFGFDFDTKSYDGLKQMGGKTAYYFYKGAEMPFTRANYLIEQTPTKIVKIELYAPGNAHNCNPPLSKSPNEISKITDQILSTLKLAGVDQTANWKTYNSKYELEVKYPDTWAAIESISPGKPYLAYITFGLKETIQQGGYFGLSIRNQTEDEYLASLKKEGYAIIDSAIKTIGDKKAIFYAFNRNDSPKSQWKDVIIENNNILFVFSRGADTRQENIFNQMLSTFKFTETDETAETANWQTYTKKDLGFSFKYPTEFILTDANFRNEIYLHDYLGRFGQEIGVFALSKSAYPKNTDLTRADILIAINRDVSGGQYLFQAVDRSLGVPPLEIEKLSLKKTVVFNGITWGMAEKDGGAAGTHSRTRIYHTFQNGSWYEVQLNLWTANDGDIPRVNENDIWNKLESVLPTFKFTK